MPPTDITQYLLRALPDLELQRLGDVANAGLGVASLPWPRADARPLSLAGQPTFVQDLGQWPGEPAGWPRRRLMVGDLDGAAPQRLRLTTAEVRPPTAPPTADAELFERCPDEGFMWEHHLLRLRWGGRSVGLAMGLRHAGEIHWWESCRLVVLEETPTCRVIEMGGAIPRIATGIAELKQYPGYKSPFLHRHNWLNGHVYARLHANGVCEIFAHHINSRFFDDGLHLEDVVPVIGITVDGPAAQADADALVGPWGGDRPALALGPVRFDIGAAARLATPEQPGRFDRAGNFLVWQPYEGVELFGGSCPRDITGDPFIYHSSQKIFPRGMARTLRFSLSLSERSPRVARYLPPAWWFGLCEELTAQPLLPVSNAYDATLESAQAWARRWMVTGGFEDGSLVRAGNPNPDPIDRGRSEPSWEGEVPWGQFTLAWRTGDAALYADALRTAYYFTDVAVDHAAKMVRMHGFAPHAFAIPMNRVQGCIAAYLECGDPYLLETAQAVIDSSHWTQKNSWPRNGVGRDGKYVRGAVMLYRYFADEHYRRLAHEGAMIVARSQRENGSFGDQSGGSGIHQWGSYITKPWMALMATEGLLDYLELLPGDPALERCVQQTGDWLMKVRYDHDGVMGWGYQHEFDGKPRHFDPYSGKWVDLPGKGLWHQETLGRLLGWCTIRSGDPAYLDAWAESRAGIKEGVAGDHGFTTAVQSLLWVQAVLWNATPDGDSIRIRPRHFGQRTPPEAKILSPRGPVRVEWGGDGKMKPTPGVVVAP